MSEVRRRMDEAMIVRGMANRAREAYLWAVAGGADASVCSLHLRDAGLTRAESFGHLCLRQAQLLATQSQAICERECYVDKATLFDTEVE